MIKIELYLPRYEAMALAELAKRMTHEDCTNRSAAFVRYDGRTEGDVMWSAIRMLQAALAEAGFNPR